MTKNKKKKKSKAKPKTTKKLNTRYNHNIDATHESYEFNETNENNYI